jgi:hypothetical protein
MFVRNKLTSASVLLALLLAPLLSTGAQESIPINKNYAAWAQEFLRAMYPKLDDKKYLVSFEGLFGYDEAGARARWLTLYIGEGPKGQYSEIIGGWAGWSPPPKDLHFGKQYYKQFLSAGFTFDEHDHLVSYGADGIAIGNAEAEAHYDDYVASHPGLSQGEIDYEIHQAGVRYGPDDREIFSKNLPLGELERFLGKAEQVSIDRIPTKVSDSEVVEWVRWKVDFRTKQADGSWLSYELVFEPFNGDLATLQARKENAATPK